MANTLKFGNGQWATGNGTALAYNDENANFKPLPFGFTRESSGTTINQSGLIESVSIGIPRIDFQGNTKGALLLEPSRTNYWTESQGSSVTLNSPLGEFGFYTINNTSLSRSITYVGTISFTFIVKKIDGTIPIITNSGGLGDLVIFVSGGSSAGLAGVLTNIGNGFYKYELTRTANGGSVARIANNSGLDTYVSLIQYEEGSYPTSTIFTSSSAVTRAADNPFQREDLASKNLIGNTEFTWFYDCILFIKEGGTTVAPKLINSSNNQIFVGVNIPQTGSNDLRIRHKDGTSASNTSSIPFTSGDRYKIAVKISGTTGSAYINGTNLGTFTTAAAVNYDKYSNAANNPNNIIDMRIYNTALTDAELVALTTI